MLWYRAGKEVYIMNYETEYDRMISQREEDADMEMRLFSFLQKVSFADFLSRIRNDIVGQDESLAEACCLVYRYLQAIATGKAYKPNFIITAPSGCGKSQFFRSINKLINNVGRVGFPIIQEDLSSFSEVGYVGRNTTDILRDLVDTGSIHGEGIVFLDEFDKKLKPSRTSAGDDINRGVQNGLLVMVEGKEYQGILCRPKSNGALINYENVKTRTVDTGKCLFIGLGAFSDLRNEKVRKATKSQFGFGSGETSASSDIYTDITYQDILDFGCSVELLGRFSQVINFHRISDSYYKRILRDYVSHAEMLPDNCRAIITAEGENDFVLQFADSVFGVRELKRRCDETIQKAIIKLMLGEDGRNNEGTCIIINGYLKAEALPEEKIMIPVREDDGCPFK